MIRVLVYLESVRVGLGLSAAGRICLPDNQTGELRAVYMHWSVPSKWYLPHWTRYTKRASLLSSEASEGLTGSVHDQSKLEATAVVNFYLHCGVKHFDEI